MSSIHDRTSDCKQPPPLRWRLEALTQRGGYSKLRQFAIWSVMQIAPKYPWVLEMIACVQVAINDPSGEELRRLQASHGGAACAACLIGLKVSPASASAQLAAFECMRPDAYEAAYEASYHARECAGYHTWSDPAATSITGRPVLEASAAALGAQIDELDRLIDSCDLVEGNADQGSSKGDC